jgi:hypothetical protein
MLTFKKILLILMVVLNTIGALFFGSITILGLLGNVITYYHLELAELVALLFTLFFTGNIYFILKKDVLNEK